MDTSAELTREEDKELLLCRVNELVFVDALTGYECRRCERTLIRHYLAPCGHYFCPNCKRLLLQSKSNCPLPACKQPIQDMDVQSVEFEQKLYDLRAHCPNKKYGCPFVSQLKDLGGHLRVCKDTREAALPVEIHGSDVLKAFMRELSMKFDKLSADVNKIKEDTSRIDKGLKDIDKKVDNNKEDIERKMAEMIRTFDGKSSKTANSLNDIKVELDKKIKCLEIKADNNNVTEIKAEINKKMTETINKFDGKSSETVNSLKDIKVEMDKKIKGLEAKVGNNNLVDTKAEIDRKITEITRRLDEKVNKTEIEAINKQINDKYSKMTQQWTRELAKVETKIKESTTYTEGKANELIRPLSRKLDDKVFELNTKITRLTNTTGEIKTSITSNKSTEIDNLDQKIFNLEKLLFLKLPQMDSFSLSEGKCPLLPDFTWTINGVANRVKQTTFEVTSEEFEWTGYPRVKARAKLEVKRDDIAYVSLILRENSNGKAIDIRSIPYVYYVLRDRSGNKDSKHRSRSMTYLFASPFCNLLDFELQFVQKSWLTQPIYNTNDSVVIDVYVEQPSMVQHSFSHDGILNWTIDNFQQIKQMEKKGVLERWRSPYFYTAPKGYRVQVYMHLHGWRKYNEKGLTAQVSFLSGEFDAGLPKTFPHRTTITLFNPNNPQLNISKTIDSDIQSKKELFINMGVHEAIENVISNDTLHYKVSITPSN